MSILGIKNKWTQTEPSRVHVMGIPDDEPTQIKFHIQSLSYPQEIGPLVMDPYVPYTDRLPVIGTRYYHDVVHHSPDIEQYRVLILLEEDSILLTYLLKIGTTYYKPVNYQEESLKYWINTIYSWTDLVSGQMTPCEHKSGYLSVDRTVRFNKKTDDNDIVSILTPESMSYYEAVGKEPSGIRCSCCKGSQLDHIPDNNVLDTDVYYKFKHPSENYRLDISNLASNHNVRRSVYIKKCLYYGNSLCYDSHRKRFYNCVDGDDTVCEIYFNYDMESVTFSCSSVLISSTGGNESVTIHRGLPKRGIFSDTTMIYYPTWMNTKSLWIGPIPNSKLDPDQKNFSQCIDVSDNAVAVRLFELYDRMERLIGLYLHDNSAHEGRIKYNQLVSKERLYDQFESFMSNTELQTVIRDATDLIDTTDPCDLDPTLTLNTDYAEIHRYYMKNRYISNSPHVIIGQRFGMYYLYTLVNRQIIRYVTNDSDGKGKELLLQIATTTWPSREVFDVGAVGLVPTLYTSRPCDDTPMDLEQLFLDGKLQKVVFPEKNRFGFGNTKKLGMVESLIANITAFALPN